jgi:hypothetical protein
MDETSLDSGAKFYAVCASHLRAAQLGQYGDNLAPEDFRKGLEDEAKGFVSNWPKGDPAFVMVSAQVDAMEGLIDRAVGIYTAWLTAGKPGLS